MFLRLSIQGEKIKPVDKLSFHMESPKGISIFLTVGKQFFANNVGLRKVKSSGKCVGHVFEVTRSDISSTTVERSSEVRGVCGMEGPFLF